jgi:hypothetical protein
LAVLSNRLTRLENLRIAHIEIGRGSRVFA